MLGTLRTPRLIARGLIPLGDISGTPRLAQTQRDAPHQIGSIPYFWASQPVNARGQRRTPPSWSTGHNGLVGTAARGVRDRAAGTLEEIEHLEIRPMFSGFGFYIDGILIGAAWEGHFQLRYHVEPRSIYEPVPDLLIDDPALLVPLVRDRAANLAGRYG